MQKVAYNEVMYYNSVGGKAMRIHGFETNDIILKEIGGRIKSRRISLSMTQKKLALESGVSLRTIINLENGDSTSFNNLVSVLRAIKLIDNLELLIPEIKINPFDVLELGHKRKRVTKSTEIDKSTWKWGEK